MAVVGGAGGGRRRLDRHEARMGTGMTMQKVL